MCCIIIYNTYCPNVNAFEEKPSEYDIINTFKHTFKGERFY